MREVPRKVPIEKMHEAAAVSPIEAAQEKLDRQRPRIRSRGPAFLVKNPNSAERRENARRQLAQQSKPSPRALPARRCVRIDPTPGTYLSSRFLVMGRQGMRYRMHYFHLEPVPQTGSGLASLGAREWYRRIAELEEGVVVQLTDGASNRIIEECPLGEFGRYWSHHFQWDFEATTYANIRLRFDSNVSKDSGKWRFHFTALGWEIPVTDVLYEERAGAIPKHARQGTKCPGCAGGKTELWFHRPKGEQKDRSVRKCLECGVWFEVGDYVASIEPPANPRARPRVEPHVYGLRTFFTGL